MAFSILPTNNPINNSTNNKFITSQNNDKNINRNINIENVEIIEVTDKNKQYKLIYTIMHIIISFFAIYLSWKCNNGFNILSFLAAILCPYLYIIWALATKGGCGIFEGECVQYIDIEGDVNL
jgi:hypothetical protein